ncbi:IclR family transcriptional regulator domain-containing protein [Novosphingobium resinovorum]|uniref:Beta-ketoadipate pathway transcriptional regulator, PcaR/PcaU/PobR family n=1 Tax=Novosphingobium resinovorum TaxID=158500 RepID=A0A031JWB5_9SPHN|nr:IclR family transcriptional regulator C-terminal domain-containing protein [Novosphingobium resinovorum]AOR79912.1 IclR family transcriptional regulator [Novosphingobium resinovorum]EZP81220.1 Beta-ketoadipate pathway transcriptional regulator, PcaR/PcaU/PobR family [Novosphingobium resinovorum]
MQDFGQLDAKGDPEFMTSLARGLAVLRCFADSERPMTIAQAARLTGLSRPAVKRCLHTLVRLGYAVQDGTLYALRPKVLALGFAYLSSSSLAMRAQPLLDQLRDDLHESCSLGVIEEDEVYYVARAEVSRIMSIALRVGSRLPLYCTSMGRVMLAGLDRPTQQAYLRRTDLTARTDRTVTEPSALLEILDHVAQEGYAIMDQELERGLRSVAVPVIVDGRVIAAVNIGTQADRVSMADLHSRYLPALRRVARDLAALRP